METARKTVVFFVIILFMLSDFFVISNLFGYALSGTNAGPMQMFSNLVFVFMIDFVPIFAMTPALTKIIRGISSRETDPYDFRSKVISIVVGLFLFLSAAAVYFSISVNNPERFLVVLDTSSDSGFNFNQMTASVGMGLTHDNSRLLSVIFGIWPLMTTTAACIIKFLDIGDSDIKREIEKCKVEIEEKLREVEVKELELNRLEKANTILDNLIEEVGAIKNRIQTYLNKEGEIKQTSVDNENSIRANVANEIRNGVMKRFGEVKSRGEGKFNKVHMGRTSECANWRTFMSQSEAKVRDGIDK